MDTINNIAPKPVDEGPSPLVTILVVVFLSLIATAGLLAVLMHVLRRRSSRVYKYPPTTYRGFDLVRSNRPLTIQTGILGRTSLVLYRDSTPMLANPSLPPHSPGNVPEIHITFPDELDENGRRKSGRVLIVHMGDHTSVGLEPASDEYLPAYHDCHYEFSAIDMDLIGGLKEKNDSRFYHVI